MKGKISPVMIAVIALVLIASGVIIFCVVNNLGKEEKVTNPEENLEKPLIELSKEYDEENPDVVKIIAVVTPNEGSEVRKIVLPDGSSVKGERAEYEVDKNGTYSFEVLCTDGTKDTLTIEVNELVESSPTNPYIPSGFTQVEGTDVETGFIIEDELGNQFVWVPVESGKLSRNTILDPKFEESETTTSGLVNSVAKYYGFYFGRYEASQYELDGEPVAASMEGKVPWTNISYLDAADYANKAWEAYGYEDCRTAMLNSFAWDTVLEWMDKEVSNYSTTLDHGNYSGTIYPTGTNVDSEDEIYGICDLAGNVREWTTEIQKENNNNGSGKMRVIRGGSATLNKSPISHVGYDENLTDNYWGFRLILYK